MQQIAYLSLLPYNGSDSIGQGGGDQRTYRCDGIPYGTLIRAGDVFSCTYFNAGAAAFVAAAVIGYRGFQGPPQ
ncbi:MAG: hypothetical protein WCJ92_08410 [Alphaproteobacteria bacterium]